MSDTETVSVGFLNGDRAHVLVTIKNAALTNSRPDFTQLAISMQQVEHLSEQLDALLFRHYWPEFRENRE